MGVQSSQSGSPKKFRPPTHDCQEGGGDKSPKIGAFLCFPLQVFFTLDQRAVLASTSTVIEIGLHFILCLFRGTLRVNRC